MNKKQKLMANCLTLEKLYKKLFEESLNLDRKLNRAED